MIPILRGALYDLMSGRGRSQVRFEGQWISWHAGNVKELRAEIARLETICRNGQPSHAGRAVRVGPRVSTSMIGYGHGYGRNY